MFLLTGEIRTALAYGFGKLTVLGIRADVLALRRPTGYTAAPLAAGLRQSVAAAAVPPQTRGRASPGPPTPDGAGWRWTRSAVAATPTGWSLPIA